MLYLPDKFIIVIWHHIFNLFLGNINPLIRILENHVLKLNLSNNKTGLQPVSRLVEWVHYLGGWSGGSKFL